jgi:TPR repeat protein
MTGRENKQVSRGRDSVCVNDNPPSLDAKMNKTSVCAAALAGLLLALPMQGWSQSARQAKPPVDAVAAARFGDAQRLEQKGDWAGALQAYHDAAEQGHGPAQKRLGDIYGSGQGDVQRDYDTSLRWYKRAQDQGEQIPQPFTYPGVRQR